MKILTGTADALPVLRNLMADEQESVVAIFLDCDQALLGAREIFRGTSESAPARPKEILAAALRAGASSVVVGHNHVSHDSTPSEDDVRFTVALEWACDAVGVRLIDHLVVAAGGAYFSFRESGLLKKK
jgi:DNA repair protein RadC